MAKLTKLERAIANVDRELEVLQQVRNRLDRERAQEREKPKKVVKRRSSASASDTDINAA